MEGSSSISPQTPVRPSSEGPTPPPRSSMEDGDSSVTRKRPRLDSGDRAYRSISAEPSSSVPTTSELSHALPTSDDKPHHSDTVMADQPQPSTPNRVTINIREQSRKAVQQTPESTQTSGLQHSVANVVPRTPSPIGSPEIEVAEVEDGDGPVIWTRSGALTITSLEHAQSNLIDKFPSLRQTNDIGACFARLQNVLNQGDLGGGELLLELAQWFKEWVQIVDTLVANPNPKFSLFDLWSNNLDFWTELPSVMEGILRRNGNAPPSDILLTPWAPDIDFDVHGVVSLLVNYSIVVARFVLMDHQTLIETQNDSGVEPDLAAKPWMSPLADLIYTGWEIKMPISLWRTLENLGWDVHLVRTAIIRQFISSPNNSFELLASCVLKMLARSPIDWDYICISLRCIAAVVEHGLLLDPLDKSHNNNITRRALKLFSEFDMTLRSMIKDQSSSLTVENLRSTITILAEILTAVYTVEPEQARIETPTGCEIELATIAATNGNANRIRAHLIALSWKLDVLYKCITSGRMESRITGVDVMSNTFLALHAAYIKDNANGSQHIIPQHGATFILEKKVVDYLVGVDSHPQLIQKCKNIVGFLCVTQRYENVVTDVIWSSMLSSQDPRRYDAILDMLSLFNELADPPTLRYFCTKLAELPIHDWDARICHFAHGIVVAYSQRSPEPNAPSDFVALWIRILRDVLKDESLIQKGKSDLWKFAAGELRLIIASGLDPIARKQILDQCLKDISETNAASTGSICVIWYLLERNVSFEMIEQELGSQGAFATLLTQDWSRLSQIQLIPGMNINETFEPLTYRAFLSCRYLEHRGASLVPELSEAMWNSLVGANAVNNHARDHAWTVLAEIVHSCRTQNDFWEKCVAEFFPTLSSQFMTPKVLMFANHLAQYHERLPEIDQDLDRTNHSLPGNIFWQIALNAPDQDTASRAINAFVDTNVKLSQKYTRERVAELHAKVVDTCVRQLIQASTELKRLNDGTTSSDEESMIIVASEKELSAARLRFARCLLALKALMQRVKGSHPASPNTGVRSSPSVRSIHGEEMVFQYQPLSNGISHGSFQLKIGDHSKLRDLVFRLSKATGFAEFQLFSGGQRIDQTSYAELPICDIMALSHRSLLVLKKPGTASRKGTGFTASLSPLEEQVMKHFQELYNLLDMNDDLGLEVYNFLVDFPPQEGIVEKASDAEQDCSSIFPLDLPWKTLYSVYVLKQSLSQRLQEGGSCNELLQCTVQKIGESITKFQRSTKDCLNYLDSRQLNALTECLLQYLREAVPESVSSTYFPQPAVLVNCLLDLLCTAQKSMPFIEQGKIIHQCFAICLEASLHSPTIWQCFQGHSAIHNVLQDVWLRCSDPVVREFCAQTVKGIIVASPSVQLIESGQFREFLWSHIENMIPAAPQSKNQAKQFFDVAVTVFRGFQNEYAQLLPLTRYIEVWSKTLLEYVHEEFVGRWSIDAIVDGLSELLQFGISLLKSRKVPIKGCEDLMQKLFKAHIFPPIDARGHSDGQKVSVPVLEAGARRRLYQLLYSLCSDLPTFHALIENLKQLLDDGQEQLNAWSHGLAQIKQEEYYDLAWNIDRNRIIRSPTGYAGLRNLSNTCYLNSLFMQLFMNVTFREFVLTAQVSSPQADQKLLHESKQLFAYLQETWLKAVDPSNVIESILTYDHEPIDIHVQMDVDEFYNLLFDRLESQMPTSEAKTKFRNIYGGRIVQQIKSKDCPHVSERVEPFSVIQCEIQGKTTLAESLSAFIEGEMMQGDNKYNCSTCNSYVNAVKRACLKDVPDNLIFHLKRFDFDLLTGTRSKINDYFEFPEEIDMAPYKIDYLEDPQQPPVPDLFMLVGILVHAGNAEAGHYYSFIRERPGMKNNWVEMNDADVTYFDFANKLQETCFGGIEPGYPQQYPKTYNAYMLFYQRIESVKAEEQRFPMNGLPVRAPVPSEILGRIRYENEHWIRRFCLLDPEYSMFCRDLIEHYRNLSKNQCTEDHKLEKDLIHMMLHHTESIFARQKDCEMLERILNSLERVIGSCHSCCRIFLLWILRRDSTFRHLALRCPDERVRRKICYILVCSLKFVKEHEPRLYSQELEDLDNPSPSRQIPSTNGLFEEYVTEMHSQLDSLHALTRSWDEYFGMLCTVANFGKGERQKIHALGFLEIALQILFVSGHPQVMADWNLANHYIRLRHKRRFSLCKLVDLGIILLQGANEAGRAFDRGDGTEDTTGFYRMTNVEHSLLRHGTSTGHTRTNSFNTVLHGAVRIVGMDPRLYRDLVLAFVEYADGDIELQRHIQAAIGAGAYADPAANAFPYLQAGIAFCQVCPEPKLVTSLITRYAEGMQSIQDSGGAEHLDFFSNVSRTSNPFLMRKRPLFFKDMLLKKIPSFAPYLIFYHDQEVRQNAIRLVKNLIFDVDYGSMDDAYMEQLVQDNGRMLTTACLNLLESHIARGKSLELTRVEDLVGTIRLCLNRFFEEDEESAEVLNEKLNKYVDDLGPLTVSTPDEASDAGMEGSDEAFSDSESGLIFLSD